MNQACEATPGSMAVILGLDADAVDAFVKALNMPHDLWVANYNCPGQIVISGTLKGIEAGVVAAKAAGAKRALPLQVHGAFHSGLMARAADELRPHIRETSIAKPKCDVYMNVTAEKAQSVEEIKELLAEQVDESGALGAIDAQYGRAPATDTDGGRVLGVTAGGDDRGCPPPRVCGDGEDQLPRHALSPRYRASGDRARRATGARRREITRYCATARHFARIA